MHSYPDSFQSISWSRSRLQIIDQTLLPSREVYLRLSSAAEVWEAIKKLRVRGAPAIGIAGAYGFYMDIKKLPETGFPAFFSECKKIAAYLNSSRPTAVNLSWALHRMLDTIKTNQNQPIKNIKKLVLETAAAIHHEDRAMCKTIGHVGARLIPENARVLTHCNTGGLATAQYGTAFSVIYHAFQQNKIKKVWVDETRPLLQGARLTTWELKKAGIPYTLHVDSAAGLLMQQGEVDVIITGADRITANGDTANKIGTYNLAVLAKAHHIPFYIAAPGSTFDTALATGQDIIIEQRPPEEVTHFAQTNTAPAGTEVFNPAFDVTPHAYITAFITDKGIIKPDFLKHIPDTFGRGN